MVHVDGNGEPDGCICELPVVEIMHKLPDTFEDAKKYLLKWQDIALRNGDPEKCQGSYTREQALQAMTVNVARQWREEHRLGSIKFGKLANMTVFDCDFLHDDLKKIMEGNIVAAIVDGEEVYKS